MTDDGFRQHKYKLFTVGAIGTFMATLDGSILNVALPTISTYLRVPVDIVAWVVLSYSLTLISLMLIFGVWIDKKGYFFGYRFGYFFFIAGSLICAVSPNLEVLVTGRIIQGIGTAMFSAIGPGMVTTVFGEKERGKGIGMMVMMVSAGFMVGPPLGGFLLGLFSWHSIFIINIPIGLFGLYMTYRYISLIPLTEKIRKIKVRGAVMISVSLVSLTVMLSFINDYALTDIRIWGIGVLSLVTFVLFLKYEAKPDTAMIGLHIFQNRQFTSAILAMLFMFISLSGISIMIPFYLEHILGYQPNQVGLFLIILPIMMFIFAPLSGKYSDKIGFRFLTIVGVIFQIVGLYLMIYYGTSTEAWYIVITFALLGIGNGIFNTPNSSALMGSVTEEYRAVTSSILGTTRNIGMSIGVALATTVFAFSQNRYADLGGENEIFIASLKPVVWMSIGIASVCLVVSAIRGKTHASQRFMGSARN